MTALAGLIIIELLLDVDADGTAESGFWLSAEPDSL